MENSRGQNKIVGIPGCYAKILAKNVFPGRLKQNNRNLQGVMKKVDWKSRGSTSKKIDILNMGYIFNFQLAKNLRNNNLFSSYQSTKMLFWENSFNANNLLKHHHLKFTFTYFCVGKRPKQAMTTTYDHDHFIDNFMLILQL